MGAAGSAGAGGGLGRALGLILGMYVASISLTLYNKCAPPPCAPPRAPRSGRGLSLRFPPAARLVEGVASPTGGGGEGLELGLG